MTCTLCAFISLVWLREQILHGGGPEWLEQDDQGPNPQRNFLDAGVVNNLVGGFGGGAARAAPANQNEENNQQQAPAAGEANEEVEDDRMEGGNNGNNAAQDDINWNSIGFQLMSS